MVRVLPTIIQMNIDSIKFVHSDAELMGKRIISRAENIHSLMISIRLLTGSSAGLNKHRMRRYIPWKHIIPDTIQIGSEFSQQISHTMKKYLLSKIKGV
mmetsp:Transcript_5047/g.4842  ORF Transcript_5047/g.4842 Transcript_5047/m.4842 type:complete len:99 (-) Transcript_5047:1351-1647(-)